MDDHAPPPTSPCGSPGRDDAPAIAELQLRAWPELYGDLLPAEAIPSGPEAVEAAAAAWRASLTKPGDARNRVLVALERNRVVGFAITGPATDPDCDPVADGELARAHRRPGRARQGPRLPAAPGGGRHDGRRPVHPGGDLGARAADDALRGFLDRRRLGAPTRAHRELDLDGTGATTVKQVRLHTPLA